MWTSVRGGPRVAPWRRRTTAGRSRPCGGSGSCSSAAASRPTRSRRTATPPRRSCRSATRRSARGSRPAPSPTSPGVGASTAKVIAAASRGELPERLAALEEEHGGPLTEGGHEIRAALRGDLHSHSDWSDGGSPIEEMAFTAMELGHDYQVLTDHSPRLHGGQRAERRAAHPAARGRRRGQRAPRRSGLHAAQGHRGRHPRRRQPRPDRRDARPARRPGGQRPLQAQDGQGRHDDAGWSTRCATRGSTCSATAPAGW